ncbi:MAG: hypothetical protein ACE5EM_01220 [Sphingomonadales bacterium]
MNPDARARLNRAVTLARSGRHDEALAAVVQAIDLAPVSEEIQIAAADMASKLNRWALAARCYEALTEIAPETLGHHVWDFRERAAPRLGQRAPGVYCRHAALGHDVSRANIDEPSGGRGSGRTRGNGAHQRDLRTPGLRTTPGP